jgi:tripeptidyl-peptidase-1
LLCLFSSSQIRARSYGDDEPSVSVAYMQAVNTVFASLGLRGITVLFASGDDGVCGGDGSCGNNGQFVPSFPAVRRSTC